MKKKKIALITGITGQDGSYLLDFLLSKKYKVHGIKRKSSQFNSGLIDHVINNNKIYNKSFFMHYGDLTDSLSLTKIIQKVKPDEIYNLAAQSHVKVSFDNPEYTSNVNALGTLRLLESVKLLGLEKKIKIYQASTSEMFGGLLNSKLNEKSPFYPRSPYAISKLYSYWICKNYREAYGMFICNGILFNHESKRRGETFLTRKITQGFAKILCSKQSFIEVGNLYSKRDWGHAKDYVEMQWLMMQKNKPDDYVIATGKQYSIKEFIDLCANYCGIKIKWIGKGLMEKGIVDKISKDLKIKLKLGDVIIKVNKKYFRPTEVSKLLGDSSKARKKLNWKPKTNINNLIKEMIDSDLLSIKNKIN